VQAYKLALEATAPAKARGLTKGAPSGRFLPKAPGPRAPGESRGAPLLDKPQLVTQLEELGHVLTQNPTSISCSLCLRSAVGTRLVGWVADGPCVGSRAPHLGLYARLRAVGSDDLSGPNGGPSASLSSAMITSHHPGGSAAASIVPCKALHSAPNVGADFSELTGGGNEVVREGRAEMDSGRKSIFDHLPHPDDCPPIARKKDLDLNLEIPAEALEPELEAHAGPVVGQASSSAAGGPTQIVEVFRTEPPDFSKAQRVLDQRLSQEDCLPIRYRLRCKTKDPLSEERVLSNLAPKSVPNNSNSKLLGRNTLIINARLGSFSKRIDPSHTLGHTKGIIWCWRCGSYAITAPQSLSGPCPRGCDVYGRSCLKRIRRGLTPRSDLVWPDRGANSENAPPAGHFSRRACTFT